MSSEVESREQPESPPTFERAGDLREWVWATLMKERQVAYPLPPRGHHPNFRGAGEAATRLVAYLLEQGHLKPGDTVISYPDYVLKPLRRTLLEAGVSVVVPAKYGSGYRLLDAQKVPAKAASSIAGAERHGEAIEVPPTLNMALLACVAVDERGDVLDKGYGFRLPDELRVLPQATVVHPLQRFESLPESTSTVRFFATPAEIVKK